LGGAPKPITHEQIAALAHEIWQERGQPEGSDIDIWLEAERQLSGVPAPRPSRERDPIPADPDRIDPDTDPAINSSQDVEIRGPNGRNGDRSPTSFGLS
jgi:hypothetical protein